MSSLQNTSSFSFMAEMRVLRKSFYLAMSSDIRQMMSQAIAQLCYQVGFDRVSESALDLLVDVGEQYMRNFALLVTKVSTLYEGNAHLEDGILALRLLKQSPRNLLRFSEEVGPYFTNQPASCTVPLVGKVCLNVPPENHEELESRPDYIPDYLPLHFNECEQIDTELSIFVKSKPTGVSVSKTDNKLFESKNVVANTTASTNFTARVLPAWAQQTSYRITRVSIDPLTKSLVEHAPPEKTQDLSPDVSSSVRGYGLSSGTPTFNDASKVDARVETQLGFSNSSLASVSYRQGATDEQWAAALQATPVPRPGKRIVFTPSRFDPSVVPAHTSSVRRSTSSTVFSTAIRRLSGSQAADNARKRPTHSVRPATNNVPKLTTANRRRRGAFGRARHWAKRRNVKKNAITSESAESSTVIDQMVNPERLLSTDSTPELKTDHQSPCPVSPMGCHDQADSKSDHTPPATPPMAAFRTRKTSPVDVHDDIEHSVSILETVPDAMKIEEELENPVTPTAIAVTKTTATAVNSSPIPPSPIQTTSPGDVKINTPSVSPQPKTYPPSPVVSEVIVEQMNAAPVSLPSPVRDRLRSQRKGRGRRRMAARTSIISSLFQNPLRKKAVVKPPTVAKPMDKKSSSTEERPSSTSVSHPPHSASTATAREDLVNTQSSRASTPTVKHTTAKPARHRSKRPPSPSGKGVSRRETSDANSLSVVGHDTTHSSPASDSTEPMLDAERASLLVMLQSPQEKPILDSCMKRDLPTPVAKANTHKLELSSVPFPGKNFDRPRNLAPIAVRALPSSPSSLESSPTSSISSTSTSLLEGPVTEHMETRVLNSVVPKENVLSPETERKDSVADSTQPKARLSLEVPKEDFSYAPPQSSPNSSVAASTTPITAPSGVHIGLNTSGPPPLLPFNKQSFDTLLPTSSFQPLSSGVNSTIVVSPPSLVPVTELHKSSMTSVKPTLSSTGTRPSPSSGQVPSNTPGGLRIKIRFGASEVRESGTSSLSPTSSSSSLSSGSSPSSPCAPERMPAPSRDPPASPVRMTTTSKEIKAGVVTDLKSVGDPVVSEHLSVTKTPKLVIRLGANTQSTNQPRGQPPNLWSTGKINLESTSHPMFKGGDLRGSSGVNSTIAPLPPPLQLTITRDRLSYRGRITSDASDSNITSSSGTESLLSSGEDDECVSVASKHNTLPPPPSLERLPDRGGLIVSGSDGLKSVSEFTSHASSSSRLTQISAGTEAIGSSVAHNQLPPLLPLFSSPADNNASQPVGTAPRLPVLDDFRTNTSSGPSSSQSASGSRKKRPRSMHKHTGSSSKRMCISSTTVTRKDPNTASEISNLPVVPASRVRVDSVFTDNESDDNGVSTMPDLIPVNPATREIQNSLKSAFRNSHTDTLTKNPTESKADRTQPRTKHTASISKPVYPPAIKATTIEYSQPAHTVSRDRNTRKHFPSSSSSTGSSATKSRITSGSYRPSSSQVVVASAGSSYYFVSSFERLLISLFDNFESTKRRVIEKRLLSANVCVRLLA
ncbi:hypothetical protein D915_009561 [Fasciola hepatica]|uniref:Bromodomain associated domain-containing protein n=1 Tax=Fasciola hepatica TaxID=6192 RepID=A0A4E0QWW7_FASHE|nr:hypothetical protein D915_009561 [Fasciola hepatica]